MSTLLAVKWKNPRRKLRSLFPATCFPVFTWQLDSLVTSLVLECNVPCMQPVDQQGLGCVWLCPCAKANVLRRLQVPIEDPPSKPQNVHHRGGWVQSALIFFCWGNVLSTVMWDAIYSIHCSLFIFCQVVGTDSLGHLREGEGCLFSVIMRFSLCFDYTIQSTADRVQWSWFYRVAKYQL